MKRDWTLVRKIVLAVEANDLASIYGIAKIVDPQGTAAAEAHVLILEQAELLTVDAMNVVRLTWKGHDLADLARDDRTWDGALEAVREWTWPTSTALITLLRIQAEQERRAKSRQE